MLTAGQVASHATFGVWDRQPVERTSLPDRAPVSTPFSKIGVPEQMVKAERYGRAQIFPRPFMIRVIASSRLAVANSIRFSSSLKPLARDSADGDPTVPAPYFSSV